MMKRTCCQRVAPSTSEAMSIVWGIALMALAKMIIPKLAPDHPVDEDHRDPGVDLAECIIQLMRSTPKGARMRKR
jgi:hypothetical protein